MTEKIKRHTTFYVNGIKPIEFCGNTFWEMELNGAFELPFNIQPTKGEHDFNTCEGCQESLENITSRLKEKFDGKNGINGFPFCCTLHSNLGKLKEFKRDSFTNVPAMVARKIIYTYQHIVNNYELDDWKKIILDYIDWAIDSFGQMPKGCGERLYLSNYIHIVIEKIETIEDFPVNKKSQIIDHLNSIQRESSRSNLDLKALLNIYEKWIKIFPFELKSYFGNLREHFRKQIPLLNGQPEINLYSGIARAKIHTKESLVNTLINLTNSLLTQINALSLYEKNKITDTEKIKLELIISSRKSKLELGYLDNSPTEEKEYSKILSQWFEDEKKFIDELTPLLKSSTVKKEETKAEKLRAHLIKHGFFEIHFVKSLEPEKREILINNLGTNTLPYNIAMFAFLGYLEYLEKNHFTTKIKLNKGLSKWFNSDKDGRSVKGNISVLSPVTNEDKNKYTAHLHIEKVKNDYESLK